MKYSDYHIHSSFSFDSREEMEISVRSAIEQGLEEICFTEHVEFDAPDEAPWPDFSAYRYRVDELADKYRTSIKLLYGVELGQPQRDVDTANALLEAQAFDFVIASIHTVGDMGRPSKYDFSWDNYRDYLNYYFTESLDMINKCDFDVIGHITFPFRYIPIEIRERYPIESYESTYRELFKEIVAKGKGIEINASGLRTPLEETMPSMELIKWYKEEGGEVVTVGSDGHSHRSIGLMIPKAYEVLKKAGFNRVTKYSRRQLRFEQIV